MADWFPIKARSSVVRARCFVTFCRMFSTTYRNLSPNADGITRLLNSWRWFESSQVVFDQCSSVVEHVIISLFVVGDFNFYLHLLPECLWNYKMTFRLQVRILLSSRW